MFSYCFYVQLLLKAAEGNLGLVPMQFRSGKFAAGISVNSVPMEELSSEFSGLSLLFS